MRRQALPKTQFETQGLDSVLFVCNKSSSIKYSKSLILSRLIRAPVKPGEIISRQRLIDLLFENREKALTLILASAGSGKTVLLSNYLNAEKNVCWLQCDPLIDNPAVLFLYLTESISLIQKQFGQKTKDYISSLQNLPNPKTVIDDLITIFLNDFSENIHENITFVIDDYQLISGEDEQWLNNVMNKLLIYIPENLKFIISSREEPSFELGRLKAKRNLFCLRTSDLAFTDDETIELLKSIYSKEINIPAMVQMTKFTEGWITGLHLLIQSSELILDEDFKFKGTGEDIFNYFTEDIFNKLEPKYQEFLITTSLLNSFTVSDADKLLGISNSTDIIKDLIRKNLFIEYFATEPLITYSYHQLFAAFLNKTLTLKFNRDKLNGLFLKAASICSEKGEIFEAIKFYVNAKSYDDAYKLINSNFESYFSGGNYLSIKKWFDSIGWENFKQNKEVILNYLKLNNAINDLKTSLNCINYVEENNVLDPRNERYQLCKAEHLFLDGKYDESIEIIEALKTYHTKVTEDEELLFLMAKVYFRKGFDFYEIVIKMAEELLSLSIEQKNSKYKIETLRLLGNIYADKGDLLTSSNYYERSLSFEGNVIKAFNSHANLVYIYSIIGDYEKSFTNLRHVQKIYENYPTTLFDRQYNRCAYQFYNNLGDYSKAILYNEALKSNETIKNSNLMTLIHHLRLVEIYYYADNKSASREVFNLARGLKKELDEYWGMMYFFCKYVYCSENVCSDKTENALLRTLNYHLEHKIIRPIAQFQFHLADYYLQTNNPETAASYLKKSLKTISSKKYMSVAEGQFVLSRHVFDFALSQNIEKEFVKEVQARLLDKKNLPFISADFKKKLEEQEKQIIDIKFSPFGNIEFYLRGKLISEDKWIRKKSKIILAYLLTKPKMLLNKDKIIDMFFQDVPLENVDTIFHNTISNIRSAVRVSNPADEGKTKTKKSKEPDYPVFIIYENKNLSLNNDYYYESDCLMFEKHYNNANSASSTMKEKIDHSVKAVELYKGEFMPGYYEPWVEEMRENYLNMYQKLCENLISLYNETDDYQNMIKYCEKLLETDKLHPEAYLKLIESHVKLNNINSARSKFASMLKNYEEELGEKPEKHVLDKISNILGSL